MDFELLRSALNNATPSEKALKGLGLSDGEIQEFVASFNVIPRNNGSVAVNSTDVIQDFFSRYDPSTLEVGMIRFLNAPKIIGKGRVIGYVEADPLVVDNSLGKVFVDDLTLPGNTLWECAQSPEQFLLALVPAADYLGQCLVDDKIRTNKVLLKSILNKCVAIAGGSSYEPFFQMILGEEEG